jgi:hypothetical protein
MSNVEMKLGDLLDQAIADMPAERRAAKRMLQRMASRPRLRAEMIDIAAGKLAESELCDEPTLAALNAEDFHGNVPLSVTPEQWKAILDFFVKNILPILISLFLK